MSQIAPHPRGLVYKFINYKNNENFNKYELCVTPLKDKKINIFFMILDIKETFIEKFTNTYKEILKELNIEAEFQKAGSKKQHYKIQYTYEYNDFYAELEEIQDFCAKFFTAMVDGLERL